MLVTPISPHLGPKRTVSRLARAIVSLVILALSGLLPFSTSADEKRLTIYSIVASYSVGLVDRNGQEYVGLLEAIEPLGSVSAMAIGSHWQLRYNNVETDFLAGSSRGHSRGTEFDLRSSFLLENGRGFVPLASLADLMSKILGGPVTLHEAGRRLFIGGVAIHFTAQMDKAARPTLIMNFTAPVNPMIATEPGKLLMIFSRDPVVAPGSPALTFDSKTIPSATYREENGTAAISISSTAPLFATFSNGNRTITIAAAIQPETHAGVPPQSQAQPPAPQPEPAQAPGAIPGAQPASAPNNPVRAAVPYFTVIDASHGGEDRGADLSDHLEEKDVTLNFARILRQELQVRGISALLIRDGSGGLSLDQRASMTNFVHPVIYVCVHASSEGQGVRLYTALLPEGGENIGTFFDWETAQANFLPLSQTAAAGMAVEFEKKQIPARTLMAPLRPLNNIATAAVAVELAPPAQHVSAANMPAYQEGIAAVIANGVLAVRTKLEAGR